jgi:hypothetical protein
LDIKIAFAQSSRVRFAISSARPKRGPLVGMVQIERNLHLLSQDKRRVGVNCRTPLSLL